METQQELDAIWADAKKIRSQSLKQSMTIMDLVRLNDYIKQKYPTINTDILHCTGRHFALIDSNPENPPMYEAISVIEVKTLTNLKKWIRETLGR